VTGVQTCALPIYWQRLDVALAGHDVYWHWVKGHAGHDMNERADELAREAIAELRAAR